ncbi:MAG TPA: hypothetical protein VFJ03_04670 [Candidatus Limnocylindria bacterium]|jgi:hypothetical protein|nr:hypothetical protein [Candidatus Limnocylindria bacterium]
MSIPLTVAVRRRAATRALPAIFSVAVLAACGSQTLSPTSPPSGSPAASGTGVPLPTATAVPTPMPTPSYTNPPDPGLAQLIPQRVRGARVDVPPHSQFAYTPGDMVPAYGDLALRFTALQVAFVVDPRLSLYAARVEGQLPTTRELEPYLPTAAEYVGISGLHRKPWRYRTIDGRVTWVRPEDDATALGTMIYTWTGGEYVFLLIGTDDRQNRAMFAALPGEKAPAATPRPTPSSTPGASGSGQPSDEPSSSP